MWQKTKRKEPDAPQPGGSPQLKKELGSQPDVSDTLEDIDAVIAAEKRAMAEAEQRRVAALKAAEERERERNKRKESNRGSCRCL